METIKKLFWGLFLSTAFFAFVSLANAQLADSPWPMYMHDAQHTGQSSYIGPDKPICIWTQGAHGNGIAIGADEKIIIGSRILSSSGTIIKELNDIENYSNAAIDVEGNI